MFLHGGNAGYVNESSAGVKGSRDADGDNIGSEGGREVSVAGVKERRLGRGRLLEDGVKEVR